MKKLNALSALLVAGMWFAVSAGDVTAQSHRLSLEGRIGAAIPTGDLSNGDAGTGLSLAAEAMYSFSPILTGYLGVSRDAFSCDEESFCDDASSSGLQGGLKFLLVRDGSLLPWVRVGLVGQSLDLGEVDSDLSLGFEAGGGIDIDVSPRFAVVPGIHYRAYSPDFEQNDELDVRYFVISLGGHLHF